MKLSDFFGEFNGLSFIPAPVIKATFAFVLIAGIIFFLTYKYDKGNSSDYFKNFPLTDVISICIDDGSIKECQRFQNPKKVKINVVSVSRQNNEKIITIQQENN